MEIYPETLQWVINKNILLVNYNPDNPFLFSGKGRVNRTITNSIGLYNLHFTYNLAIKRKLEAERKAKTLFLPFAFDVSDEIYGDYQQQKEILRCCFIGNPDADRAVFIKQLAVVS